jgi:hypothetical protein
MSGRRSHRLGGEFILLGMAAGRRAVPVALRFGGRDCSAIRHFELKTTARLSHNSAVCIYRPPSLEEFAAFRRSGEFDLVPGDICIVEERCS